LKKAPNAFLVFFIQRLILYFRSLSQNSGEYARDLMRDILFQLDARDAGIVALPYLFRYFRFIN